MTTGDVMRTVSAGGDRGSMQHALGSPESEGLQASDEGEGT